MEQVRILNPLLRPQQVAEILGVKLSTIYKYSMSGTLPSVKINGNLRFQEKQIQDFIQQHTKPAVKALVTASQ
ncbi:MAG: helix-turn-helix domain-containing protein [Planctomycetes bacterium]|nr:helix-turn-helix domain-containing protein [Planctomycetota bacterium]